MSNMYLKDLLNYESPYQGVITPHTTINFYSLCRKVYEKADDGNRGIRRTEVYKMRGFTVEQLTDFFVNNLTQDQTTAIVAMIQNSQNRRALAIGFQFGLCGTAPCYMGVRPSSSTSLVFGVEDAEGQPMTNGDINEVELVISA